MVNNILLALAALLPAIVLGVYIFIKDRVEKEPVGLLGALFVGGVISVIPILIVEQILDPTISNFFGNFIRVEGGNYYMSPFAYHMYHMTDNMIGVALVEEGFKWLVMWILTSKNKNFNSLFDGIVYAVFVSLGFATLENILYVFDNGWSTAIARMVTAVPGHTFDAIIMGYYYSNWHMYERARVREADFRDRGMLIRRKEPFSGKQYLFLSILMPVLAHGFYDYCCSVGTVAAMLVFVAFLIFLYVYCFAKVRKMSNADALDMHVADALLLQKYPELMSYYAEGRTERKSSIDDLKKELYADGREEAGIY